MTTASPDDETAFVRDTLRFFGVDKPTFSYTLKRAIDDGYLVGYQIYKARTVKTATADGIIKILREDIQWDGLDARDPQGTRRRLCRCRESETAAATYPEVDPNALERKFTIPARNQAIVREFRKVMDEGYTDKQGRSPQTLDRQDHRFCRHQAPRRNAGDDARQRIRPPETLPGNQVCRLRRLRHGARAKTRPTAWRGFAVSRKRSFRRCWSR